MSNNLKVSKVVATIGDIEVISHLTLEHWSVVWPLFSDSLRIALEAHLRPDVVIGSYHLIKHIIDKYTFNLCSAEYENIVSEFQCSEIDDTYSVIKLISPQVLNLIFIPTNMERKVYIVDRHKNQACLLEFIE